MQRDEAQMAELVDALGSGPSGGNTVEVRVLFWAPQFRKPCSSSRAFSFLARKGKSLRTSRGDSKGLRLLAQSRGRAWVTESSSGHHNSESPAHRAGLFHFWPRKDCACKRNLGVARLASSCATDSSDIRLSRTITRPFGLRGVPHSRLTIERPLTYAQADRAWFE